MLVQRTIARFEQWRKINNAESTEEVEFDYSGLEGIVTRQKDQYGQVVIEKE